jgi:hypothetical protein
MGSDAWEVRIRTVATTEFNEVRCDLLQLRNLERSVQSPLHHNQGLRGMMAKKRKASMH